MYIHYEFLTNKLCKTKNLIKKKMMKKYTDYVGIMDPKTYKIYQLRIFTT